MTIHDIRVAQHAPIPLLIHEVKPGFTTIELDVAASPFSKATDGNEEVVKVGKFVDELRDSVFQKVFDDVLGEMAWRDGKTSGL